MIPMWKLQRELDRLGQKLRSILAYPIEGFTQARYDRAFPKQLTITDGTQALTPKVALLLIYQPGGIPASLVEECKHFIEHGYAPFIISNAPLNDGAIETLKPITWKIVQRPNYGYDFGGYRDGVRLLERLNITPDTLIIANDSIWFPLHPNATVLPTLENNGAHVSGIVYHEDIVRRSKFSTRKAFLESYFFHFDQTALGSDAFRSFWDTYRVSSNKLNAVYRGERRLCDHMREGGLTVQGLVDRNKLLAELAAQGPEFLRKTLEYGAYTDSEFATESAALIDAYAPSDQWKADAIAHVKKVTMKRNLHASFCYATMQLFDVCTMKKSNGTFLKGTYATLHSQAREQYLRAIDAGDTVAPFDAIPPEIRSKQAQIDV